MKIAYLGFQPSMIEKLISRNDLTLCACLCEEKFVTDKYSETCNLHSVPCVFVNNNDDIMRELSKISVELVIIYKTSIIIKGELLAKYRFVNFHPGDLRTNRGKHPIVQTILRGMPTTKMSLYELTGGIDEGVLISEHSVTVDKTDTPLSIENKLEVGIPNMLSELIRYFEGSVEGILVTGGTYLPAISKDDYTISLNDEEETIRRKILSQRDYSGAVLVLDDVSYHCFDMYFATKKEKKDGIICIQRGNGYLHFDLNEPCNKGGGNP